MSEFFDPSDEIIRHGDRLPHWQQCDSMQFVTFRLGDAMPQAKLRKWREELDIWNKIHPAPWSEDEEREYRTRFIWKLENWLDEGMGSCLLADAVAREEVGRTLMNDEGKGVEHHAWVIMPNHVHLLFTARKPLEKLMHVWKGVSSRRIGSGRIWKRGYRDTMVRNERHFENAVRYIRNNPRKLREGSFTLWENERARLVPDKE